MIKISGPTGKCGTALLTAVALLAFAANSILCRQALGTEAIDAAAFSAIRLISGAVTLLVLTRLSGKRNAVRQGGIASAAALFTYVVCFSFAYVTLSAGSGALILFAAVQTTMILSGLRSGERPGWMEWGGLFLALVGLVLLVLPGLSAPSPIGSALMAAAGVAWGMYSLSGRGTGDPMLLTSDNFVRCVPMAFLVPLFMRSGLHVTPKGIELACLSGSIASACGYVVWYRALAGLTATLAATVQLVVPVLAAAGGAILLSETVTARFMICAGTILGGVALAVTGRARHCRRRYLARD